MSGDWKPGTVAKATVGGVTDVLVLRRETYQGGTDWAHSADGVGYSCSADWEVTNIRPLVVLDPSEFDADQIRVAFTVAGQRTVSGWPMAARVLRTIFEQITAQTSTPRPAEPKGLGAVVEDSSHIRWVRVSNAPGTFPWLRDGHGVRGWSEIDAIRVLSEGVTA